MAETIKVYNDNGEEAEEPLIGVLAHQGDLAAANAPLEHVGAQIGDLLVELTVGVGDYLLTALQILEGDVIGTVDGLVLDQFPQGPVGGKGLRRSVGFLSGKQALQRAGDDTSVFNMIQSESASFLMVSAGGGIPSGSSPAAASSKGTDRPCSTAGGRERPVPLSS